MPLSQLVLLECIGGILFGSLVANAEIPKTPEFKNYSHLLQRSPFEIKINQMVEQLDKPQVRMDYFLRGVTKLESGWMIVIVDRKKPKENIIIKQGANKNSEMKLLDVIQNKEDYKLTLAKLKIGSQEMTIGYNKAELQRAFQQSNKPATPTPLKTKQTSQKGISSATTQNKQQKQPIPAKKEKSLTPAF